MFKSEFKALDKVALPELSGIRIMMMPVICSDENSLPEFLNGYKDLFNKFSEICNMTGKIAYLTIDEKLVKSGETHRRKGLHVDGVLEDSSMGGWAPPGGWGCAGMLTVSNIEGCRAWSGEIISLPGFDGNCEHIRPFLKDEGTVFEKNRIYWLDGFCVHESIPQTSDIYRSFIRFSYPSDAPWFEGYTENPLGIKPTGKIWPKRSYL